MFDSDFSRRDFMKAAAALGAVSVWPAFSGCAAKSNARCELLVIGGGAAGLPMAARMRKRLPNANITLVDPAQRQFYQPGFTLLGGGVYTADKVWRPQRDFIPAGVKWIRQAVAALDPVKKTAALADGTRLNYDFLVLAPGIQLNWGAIEGITRDTLGRGNAHSIYDFEGAQKTFPAMVDFVRRGGRGLFCDTHTKLKCGGAPKKICLLTEHRARMQKRREAVKIDYLTASKELYDVPFYTPRLKEIYRERGVGVTCRMKLTGVDTEAKKAHFVQTVVSTAETKDPKTGETKRTEQARTSSVTESYDFFHFAPPQSAPDFVRQAGLGWREGKLAREAWVEVDKHTLVHRVYPNIVSLGDVAGIPTSKTSAAIRKQIPVAEENLLALIDGKSPERQYNGYAACPIVTDYGHVLLCEFDYDKKPQTSFPFSLLDTSKELRSGWWLKVHFLRPFYFNWMLRGK